MDRTFTMNNPTFLAVKMVFCFNLVFMCLLFSCNRPSEKNAPFDLKTLLDDDYINPKELEVIINQKREKEPKLFLDYWAGMNSREVIYVTNELIKKSVIDGFAKSHLIRGNYVFTLDEDSIKVWIGWQYHDDSLVSITLSGPFIYEDNIFQTPSEYYLQNIENVEYLKSLYIEKYGEPELGSWDLLRDFELIHNYLINNPPWAKRYKWDSGNGLIFMTTSKIFKIHEDIHSKEESRYQSMDFRIDYFDKKYYLKFKESQIKEEEAREQEWQKSKQERRDATREAI